MNALPSAGLPAHATAQNSLFPFISACCLEIFNPQPVADQGENEDAFNRHRLKGGVVSRNGAIRADAFFALGGSVVLLCRFVISALGNASGYVQERRVRGNGFSLRVGSQRYSRTLDPFGEETMPSLSFPLAVFALSFEFREGKS